MPTTIRRPLAGTLAAAGRILAVWLAQAGSLSSYLAGSLTDCLPDVTAAEPLVSVRQEGGRGWG